MTHRCAAPGCNVKIAEERLMCLPHWRQVGPNAQQAVWRTWRALQQSNSGNYRAREAEYRAARDRAIQCVCRPGAQVADLFPTT